MKADGTDKPRRKRVTWARVLLGIGAVLFLLYVVGPVRQACENRRYSLVDYRTRSIIQSLSVGLDAFKSDWGVYPPNSRRDGGAQDYGYQNLAYYLMGPTGEGWGPAGTETSPFGAELTKTYGPYFMQEHEKAADSVLDAFRPPKPILYYRFEIRPKPHYEVRDNPVDPTCRTGFASREHFELSARYRNTDGKWRWQREDYLLISPGRDRLYGHVVEDERTGDLRPATRENIEAGRTFYDDITNFQ